MSSLVEPWQNIGIYDCQLSKIEKLKNKIKSSIPIPWCHKENHLAEKKDILCKFKKWGKKHQSFKTIVFLNKKCMRFLVKEGGDIRDIVVDALAFFLF
jgi:exoribonuclease II